MPIGGISWEPEGMEDKWVDLNCAADSGIQEEFEKQGYRIAWCESGEKVSRKVDLEGWEVVVWEDPDGNQFILKCGSGSKKSLTLLMKNDEASGS